MAADTTGSDAKPAPPPRKISAKAVGRKKAAAKKVTAKKAPAKKAAAKKAAPKKAVAKRTPVEKAGPEVSVTPRRAAPAQPAAQSDPQPAPKPPGGLREREASRVFALAADYHRRGRLDEAIKGYGRALALNPLMSDVYNNMGVALRAQGRLEAAVACYRRALALNADSPSTYSNMGNALREMGRFRIAAASHSQAVRLAPGSAEAIYNLGLTLRDMGENERAMGCLNRSLQIRPDYADAHWDRSLSRLLEGNLERGFDEYEWRWRLDRSPPREFQQPQWTGKAIPGKTLFIHQEQGFGDMIQMARYAAMARTQVGQIVVECQAELARLMATVRGVDKVLIRGAALPRFDAYIPALSLPRVLGTTMQTIPKTVPYIRPPDVGSVRLPPSAANQTKVGIVWAGKPTHRNDRNRSAPFGYFLDLMGVPGFTMYSLQKGERAEDLRAMGSDALVMDLGEKLTDFADTAAVIDQLDLVITVDTAVAHLAGALGKPVWVLLPFAPDWRWLLKRTDSPWYPTARLFRQPKAGDWDSVFADVRRAMRAMLNERSGEQAPKTDPEDLPPPSDEKV